MTKSMGLTLAFVFLLTLSGCGSPNKQSIVQKAQGIKTKAELESVLGKPDAFEKAAVFEVWTYKASDGQVNFRIMGDKVLMTDTAKDKDRDRDR